MQFKNIAIVLLVVLAVGSIAFAQSDSEPVQMEFVNDMAMGIPVQDVYIDAGVIRPQADESMMREMMEWPVFTSGDSHAADYEEPFDVGPFVGGESLGFTLGDWLAMSGTGTYTVDGDRATFDIEFENLIPNGVYTVWCLQISDNFVEAPCGAADGSQATFIADEEGNASWMLETDALPPSTEDAFYSVAIAYHSDGETYGEVAGDFGKNVHVPMWFDFSAEHADMDVVEISFVDDFDIGAPVQDVYVDAGVVRPEGPANPSLLEQPLYSTVQRTDADFDGMFGITPQFNVGPFERGEALGVTVEDWLMGTGTGTYTVNGDSATLDLTFENLIPNGLYTLWCMSITFPPDFEIIEAPCGAEDGSESTFTADEEGNAAITIEMAAFAPSTAETIHEVALAHHSDGRTYGPLAGDFGKNVHIQMVYDFLAPES